MALFKKTGVVAIAGVIALAGCANPDGTTNNTATGTGIGALFGAVIGANNSSNPTTGAVVGGAIGAAVGNVIGQKLDQQEAELRDSLGSEVGIVNTGNQLIVSLPEGITFDVNSYTLKPSLVGDLNILAMSMNDYPDTVIEVVGHTDNTGTVSYNQMLSEQRALAVRSALIKGGVSPSRINARGAGETQPIATNATVDRRQENRRVEIYITPVM